MFDFYPNKAMSRMSDSDLLAWGRGAFEEELDGWVRDMPTFARPTFVRCEVSRYSGRNKLARQIHAARSLTLK